MALLFCTALPAHADILRGGGGGGGAAAPAGSGAAHAGAATPADTTRARQNAQDALARTSNTLSAIRAMQQAARDAAQGGPTNLAPGLPHVPNGLGIGGLNPATASAWSGAEAPVQSIDADGLINVGIRQTAQQALLDWQTFNVGKETRVSFDQSATGAAASQSIAFNRVNDPSGNPSQILGQIQAQGQVYLINPNGIIFGGSSKVDVNTLTLSSLPINPNLIDRGLLNNPDSQFLFSGLDLPAFTPPPPPISTGRYGDVIIQAGARIDTPVSADGNGGRVLLVGPNVTNNGSIHTPNGQTILAAGLQVGLAAHNSADPSLRGLDVFIGQTGLTDGVATNNGLISAPRGNITLAGRDVRVNGALAATTSTSLNGRIDLLAHYGATPNTATGTTDTSAVPFLNRQSGTITLGDGALISILPEYGSAETAIGSELALRSRVNLEGRDIHLGAFSTLFAPNAIVRLAAGDWLFTGGTSPISRFLQSVGSIDIGENALLNVAGSIDVNVSVAQNIIEVDLRGSELANSPLQRSGPLRGTSIQVDIRSAGVYNGQAWIGTPLGDISGFANLIERDIGQLTTAGGSITLSAGESASVRKGAVIDVSGGSIAWQDSIVKTTWLSANGRLYDISQATPDVRYDGIYTGLFDASSARWGVTEIYQNPLSPGSPRLHRGYLEGGAGGSLSITAPSMAIDGELLGKTFAGEYQREEGDAPQAASLALGFTSISTEIASNPIIAPNPPNIYLVPNPVQVDPGPFGTLPLAADRVATVLLPLDLWMGGGFRNVTINNPDGTITLPEGSTLHAQAYANLNFNASNITINGSIYAPGGQLTFTSPNLSLTQINTINNTSISTTPLPNPGRGTFSLGSSSIISTAGLLVDDRVTNPAAASQPLAIHGGSVTINAFNTILNPGAAIDVSGGARADARGRISYGDAGSISAAGGRDLNVSSVLGGTLLAQSNFFGYSGVNGGTLSLSAPAFQIGGAAPEGVVFIDPEFFNQGGFANFALTGLGLRSSTPGVFIPGVLVAENTTIAPVVQSLLAVAPANGSLHFLEPFLNEEGRRNPASISLTATGATSPFTSSILVRGEVVLASGSSIITDAGGSVSLRGQTTTILGLIRAPGGAITASGASDFPLDGDPQLLTTLLLGSNAVLDASGKHVALTDPRGLRTGTVFSGGSITLSGNILANQGALLIASGASGVLDLAPSAAALNGASVASINGRLSTPVTLDSSGGTITLAGSNFLHSDATLIARAGGASANGGSLIISSSRFVPPNTTSSTADINLIITASPTVTSTANPSITGTRPLDEFENPVSGLGRISTTSFAGGGFNNLTLAGNVRTQGDVSITLPGAVRLATSGILDVAGSLTVNAAYIHVGQSFRAPVLPGTVIEYFTSNIPGVGQQPLSVAPTSGAGIVSLNAGMLDLGTLSFLNTGFASFNAFSGDIRGNGTLQAAGSLAFTSGQLYPTTGSTFNIYAYGDSGVTFLGGASSPLPYSAGGTLNVHATSIVQNGTLRAPLGTINLGWDGVGTAPVNPVAGNLRPAPVANTLTLGASSITSNSAIDPLTGAPATLPYGISFDGESWINPLGLDITTIGPIAKDIKLTALNLTTEAGSIIDISGGGDMFAYRWISGNGGTEDILASEGVFAIIPGYAINVAPYAPFNPNAAALEGEAGYVNNSLRPGDQITLAEGSGVPAGTYTLLPARYALLPGAYLVTPIGGTPVAATQQPDGSTIVSGYRANNLSADRTGPTRITNFEIAPVETLAARAEYQQLSANTFFAESAASREVQPPRLPQDAGILSFTASNSLNLFGSVRSFALPEARGALIDINSPVDILINATGFTTTPGTLALSASLLNSFAADSLLIGGVRTQTATGISVATSTNRLTLDNGSTTLFGNDLILTSREELLIADNASIASTGSRAVGSITLGNSDTPGSGNGVLVRVSGNLDSEVERRGVTPGGLPSLVVGAGASITGTAVTLDSTAATSLSSASILRGTSLTLSSGEITLVLDNPGIIAPTIGAVLDGIALDSLLASTTALTLRSYSNLNFYGTGQVGSDGFDSLTLQAGAIRGLNQDGGLVNLTARRIALGNPNLSTGSVAPLAADGSLALNAQSIILAGGPNRIDGFALSQLNASSEIRVASEGSLAISDNLFMQTPVLLGQQAADYRIAANGALTLAGNATPSTAEPGIGVNLELVASSVALNGNITLPSGRLTVRSTTGDLEIGGSLDLAGVSREFVDVTRHTSGGIVSLAADQGSVRILNTATVNLSAPAQAGNAGQLDISTPLGSFELLGSVIAFAGADGVAGSFTLDTAALPSLAALDATLNAGAFTGLRDYRIRTGDVSIDGSAIATTYRLAADDGDVHVSGTIDASGTRGGTIDIKANGSLNLLAGSVLDASAVTFDAAGKGGGITLEAGAQRNGIINTGALLNLQAGSTILLGVDAWTPASASLGQFQGTLHLRAPRNATNDDLAIATIGADVQGSSAITVEGYRIYDRTATGTLDTALLNTIRNDANAYLSLANYNAMLARLTAANPALDLILMPGAEIINRTGGLTLGATNSNASADWNLATLRFGPRSAPGVLTLRAANGITFFNALSDGFNGGTSLWLSPLLAHNPLLPANSQSWSYRITAGADLSAASFRHVLPNHASGNIEIGKNMGAATATGGTNATTASIITNNFQVIRTGSGSIDLHASANFRLLNPFASVYTAGTLVANPNTISSPGDFITPILNLSLPPLQGSLGAFQQSYFVQYSMAGGNVTIQADGNLERKTRNNSGLIDDSSRQLPNNWLYRRSYVDDAGLFGNVVIGNFPRQLNDPAASTTWWVDFSNFFQSVGALGGGNITLAAGNDIINVDAVIPTNARAASGTPDPAKFIELGGGDLRVTAGRDISGGVYYVERGEGALAAGRDITTNAARSPSFGILNNLNNPAAATFDPQTWMPTTLFVGKSSFGVTASGNILIGPTTNPFLLPQGLNNRFWYKTYFSTFAPDSAVRVTSLGGNITFRNAVTLPATNAPRPVLQAWLESQNLLGNSNNSAAWTQPWLRLTETSIIPLVTPLSVAAPNLEMTSFAGNINLVGNLTLFPSPTGNLEILAAKGISGFQPTGISNNIIPGQSTRVWTTATWNVSNADPSALPGIFSPLSNFGIYGGLVTLNTNTQTGIFAPITTSLVESGSFSGVNAVLQTKQARNAPGILHRDDFNPVRLASLGGDISGITLFTPKSAIISAARDITDIALYLQNLRPDDNTIVAAGRDIIAFNNASLLRLQSIAQGNAPASNAGPRAGDIQISGPGTLQVLAGRNLDLGTGASFANGTGAGISSIGNFRNPFLSPQGADIIALAGIGPATSLVSSKVAIDAFLQHLLDTPEGANFLASLLPNGDPFALDDRARSALAIEAFFITLRDAGRDFNNPDSPDAGTYRRGEAAIAALFGTSPAAWNGQILARGRDIRTRAGGDISLLAPGGGLALANTTIGNPLAPPGIITEAGGKISIFTDQSVNIGVGRIFTLRGGDVIIWSSNGDIAAGSSSRTVQSAPPTRVVVDPQSAAVETNLAGLATGGGIGVLATVAGVDPGDVDLIAPSGTIDAGDAGIRVSGNINLAAVQVTNAGNIVSGGTSTGGGVSVAAPAVASVAAPPPPQAPPAAPDASAQERAEAQVAEPETQVGPSIISVEVIGYGGAAQPEDEDEDEDENAGADED